MARINFIFINIILFLLWLIFAYRHSVAFLLYPRAYILLFIVAETLLAFLFLLRKQENKISKKKSDWLIASLATFIPLSIQPSSQAIQIEIGTALMVAGSLLYIFSLISLNRSMGIIPADRGIKTNGLYRLVRHPIYLSYLILYTGYILASFSYYNFIVYIFTIIFIFARILIEEKFLSSNPVYLEYKNRVRQKLIPYIL